LWCARYLTPMKWHFLTIKNQLKFVRSIRRKIKTTWEMAKMLIQSHQIRLTKEIYWLPTDYYPGGSW
jgi:hypothetical protein